MEALAKFAGWLILITLSTLFFGWVATTIWGWYIVPTLGWAPLKYKTAIGFSYLLDLQLMGLLLNTGEEYKNASTAGKLFVSIVSYAVLLGIAGFFYLVLP